MVNNHCYNNFDDYLHLVSLAAQLPAVFVNLHREFNQELCLKIWVIKECSKRHKYHLMVGPYPSIHVYRFVRKSPFVECVKLYNSHV